MMPHADRLDRIVGSCLLGATQWHAGMSPASVRAAHEQALTERRTLHRQQAALVENFGHALRAERPNVTANRVAAAKLRIRLASLD